MAFRARPPILVGRVSHGQHRRSIALTCAALYILPRRRASNPFDRPRVEPNTLLRTASRDVRIGQRGNVRKHLVGSHVSGRWASQEAGRAQSMEAEAADAWT